MLAACGGEERQDENEPEATYRVQVLDAKFPEQQKLAKRSTLEIIVRNADNKTIPNIAVTVKGFSQRSQAKGLADPNRPIFVINGVPKEIGGFPEAKEAAPESGETAYVDTWALGPLRPDEEKTFKWSVTAIKAGPYRIRYEVAAGLDGKAKAVDEAGTRPTGLFVGRIEDRPPDTRVADDGRTIVEGTR